MIGHTLVKARINQYLYSTPSRTLLRGSPNPDQVAKQSSAVGETDNRPLCGRCLRSEGNFVVCTERRTVKERKQKKTLSLGNYVGN